MKRFKLPPLHRNRGKERGFTLIEIVIFIIIIGVAAGILLPLTQSVRGSVAPVFTQQAITLAQGELDQVVAQRRAGGFGSVVLGNPAACAVPMLPGFICSRTVCSVPAADLNNTGNCLTLVSDYRRVAVAVTHASIGSVTAVTLLTNY